MSLLQSEDFAIYQLRTSYLSSVHDGVGERLISVNTTFLNNPAFRAAGWSANPPELKRCYSPPIPTAVTSEYFQAPRSAALASSLPEDEDEGGMLTGTNTNDNMVGPAIVKRRRRREQPEEDDSSDLSDESDEYTEDVDRPAQQIRFAKMPERSRAGSSPIRGLSQRGEQDVSMTSPSRPPDGRPRRGSLGAVEAMKERHRRDTTTSSELSFENEVDSSLFRRREIAQRANAKSKTRSDRIKEDGADSDALEDEVDPENLESDSDDSSLASELLGSDGSASFFDETRDRLMSSPLQMPRPASPRSASPKKTKQVVPTMAKLPPARPISIIQPRSMLTAMIKAKSRKPASPFERFATLSGSGDPNPLYVKIYAPFSSKPTTALELLLKRHSHEGEPVTVADTIGHSLWKYGDEKIEPPLASGKMNVNCWTLRMVEDGEVDYDFPALSRIRPVTDFTSNNNRGARGRSRDKPWDEFALVEATDAQFTENERLTPVFSQEAASLQEEAEAVPISAPPLVRAQTQPVSPSKIRTDPFSGVRPLLAARHNTNPLDAPATRTPHAVPRTGTSKNLNIHFTDHDLRHNLITIPVTTDTYIAEVFDDACKRFNLDKALYVLKVTNSNTVAPADRTVEALGPTRSSLDLVRRRFIAEEGAFGLGVAGSPGSTSPNAPLFLTTSGTPKKHGKKGREADPALPSAIARHLAGPAYKRYNVLRKQPMSFAPPHPRVLALDGEYLQILPGDTHGVPGEGKVTTVPFTSVVGCKVNRKHPKTFRVVVFKERETKRYDFEAPGGAEEAARIVADIKRGTERFREGTSRRDRVA